MKTSAPLERGRYQGMLQILSFNAHFYFLTAMFVVAVAGALFIGGLGKTMRVALVVAAVTALYWAIASLAASHWIYDRSPIYQWTWIGNLFENAPRRWANIHAGWDESTVALKALFPSSAGIVLDIFDPKAMTEPSIAKARKTSAGAPPALPADFRALPLPNCQLDAAFLIFAAHELRERADRVQFFGELRRVLTPNAHALLVEHMRDWKNFAAFGPGFMHFFSRPEWVEVIKNSGFEIEREFSMTPFVRIFLLRRPQ